MLVSLHCIIVQYIRVVGIADISNILKSYIALSQSAQFPDVSVMFLVHVDQLWDSKSDWLCWP